MLTYRHYLILIFSKIEKTLFIVIRKVPKNELDVNA